MFWQKNKILNHKRSQPRKSQLLKKNKTIKTLAMFFFNLLNLATIYFFFFITADIFILKIFPSPLINSPVAASVCGKGSEKRK